MRPRTRQGDPLILRYIEDGPRTHRTGMDADAGVVANNELFVFLLLHGRLPVVTGLTFTRLPPVAAM